MGGHSQRTPNKRSAGRFRPRAELESQDAPIGKAAEASVNYRIKVPTRDAVVSDVQWARLSEDNQGTSHWTTDGLP